MLRRQFLTYPLLRCGPGRWWYRGHIIRRISRRLYSVSESGGPTFDLVAGWKDACQEINGHLALHDCPLSKTVEVTGE